MCLVVCVVCVCVFFTLTDRVSIIPSKKLRGCQSGTYVICWTVNVGNMRNMYYVVPVLPCVSKWWWRTQRDRVSIIPSKTLRGCQSGTYVICWTVYVGNMRNMYYVVPVLPCVSKWWWRTQRDRVSIIPSKTLRGCQSGTYVICWTVYVGNMRNMYYVVPVLPCVSKRWWRTQRDRVSIIPSKTLRGCQSGTYVICWTVYVGNMRNIYYVVPVLPCVSKWWWRTQRDRVSIIPSKTLRGCQSGTYVICWTVYVGNMRNIYYVVPVLPCVSKWWWRTQRDRVSIMPSKTLHGCQSGTYVICWTVYVGNMRNMYYVVPVLPCVSKWWWRTQSDRVSIIPSKTLRGCQSGTYVICWTVYVGNMRNMYYVVPVLPCVSKWWWRTQRDRVSIIPSKTLRGCQSGTYVICWTVYVGNMRNMYYVVPVLPCVSKWWWRTQRDRVSIIPGKTLRGCQSGTYVICWTVYVGNMRNMYYVVPVLPCVSKWWWRTQRDRVSIIPSKTLRGCQSGTYVICWTVYVGNMRNIYYVVPVLPCVSKWWWRTQRDRVSIMPSKTLRGCQSGTYVICWTVYVGNMRNIYYVVPVLPCVSKWWWRTQRDRVSIIPSKKLHGC